MTRSAYFLHELYVLGALRNNGRIRTDFEWKWVIHEVNLVRYLDTQSVHTISFCFFTKAESPQLEIRKHKYQHVTRSQQHVPCNQYPRAVIVKSGYKKPMAKSWATVKHVHQILFMKNGKAEAQKTTHGLTILAWTTSVASGFTTCTTGPVVVFLTRFEVLKRHWFRPRACTRIEFFRCYNALFLKATK